MGRTGWDQPTPSADASAAEGTSPKLDSRMSKPRSESGATFDPSTALGPIVGFGKVPVRSPPAWPLGGSVVGVSDLPLKSRNSALELLDLLREACACRRLRTAVRGSRESYLYDQEDEQRGGDGEKSDLSCAASPAERSHSAFAVNPRSGGQPLPLPPCAKSRTFEVPGLPRALRFTEGLALPRIEIPT